MSRPISPHLTWYKPQITSVLSIMHRFTGIALAAGALALAWWVVAVAIGGEVFTGTTAVYTSVIGQIVLALWTLALAFHMSNGIRHLCWDAGWGFQMRQVRSSGWLTLAMTVILTALVWVFVLLV
ncbi:succinate dehydrogenase, cytochrome b556 subunit [Oleiagrimonas sp. C23AA]|uniref:succinate dehydrogenase, cytochrome b556 subunit n=1 Tax=Oleiagrimonas sp. C23AA TaxID=2719047 RepID=UPI0014238C58|nr:succinate dehydrogenase, cytochrome b556 subunit [Oleiagrimonas sp. C23AA]NII09093.1 succinate dehydrogenase, cytochrome b556 subunit [Oleiagrimonas sp. C23AA]